MLTGLVRVRARVSQPGARGLGDRARVRARARVRVRVRVSRPGARGLGDRCAALHRLGVEDLGSAVRNGRLECVAVGRLGDGDLG